MIKHLLSTLALCATLSSGALTFGTPQALTATGEGAFHPVLSPDGKILLFSSMDHTGLNALDLTTGKTTLLDQAAAAGFCPIFATDSRTVIYRTACIEDGLVFHDVRTATIDGTEKSVIRKMSRDNVNLNAQCGNTTYVDASLNGIQVVNNGISTLVNPVEDAHSYLWASISPDGQRILFVEPFKGVFTCDLDGSNLKRISDKGDYPCWVSNDVVVFVLSRDDGYVTLSSQLIATDLNDGSFTTVTDAETMVGELTAAAGKVVYSTLEGNLFTLTLK